MPLVNLCLAHSIPSAPMSMQHMHQHNQQWYDPLHIITWSYWFINLDFTHFSPLPSSIGTKSCLSFAAMRSIAPKPPTCPSRLQWAMRSFIITCVSFATPSRHFHFHGICCSHTYTCGLIICVSHINTISLPRLLLNYQNQTRTFQLVSNPSNVFFQDMVSSWGTCICSRDLF